MSNWADELRALLVENEDTIWAALEINIRALVSVGERQLEHALNTVECLVEANAALREQLCEFKQDRRNATIGKKEPG